jgi:uncharacterized protein
MSFFVILLIVFFAGDALWWLSAHRRLKGRPARVAAGAFALVQGAGLAVVLGSRWMGVALDAAMPRPVLSLIFIWHLLVIVPWMLWVVAVTLARGISAMARRMAGARKAEVVGGLTRREFFASASVFGPAILATGSTVVSEPQLERFGVRRLIVPIPTLPPALDGLTIVHVSDVHVGRFTRDAILGRIADATNDLAADLVLFTGDLINFSMRDLPAGIALLKAMRSAHGTFLCEGNHDLFEDAAGFRNSMRDAGLALLVQEGATLTIRGTRVQVLGLPWLRGDANNAAGIRQLADGVQPGAFPILLAHHPHAFDSAGDIPLMVAGHTHGGQLMLNAKTGFGPWLFRYWSGLYERGGSRLVVSNGVGNWFPLRVNAPAEIAHLTLRSAG